MLPGRTCFHGCLRWSVEKGETPLHFLVPMTSPISVGHPLREIPSMVFSFRVSPIGVDAAPLCDVLRTLDTQGHSRKACFSQLKESRRDEKN